MWHIAGLESKHYLLGCKFQYDNKQCLVLLYVENGSWIVAIQAKPKAQKKIIYIQYTYDWIWKYLDKIQKINWLATDD